MNKNIKLLFVIITNLFMLNACQRQPLTITGSETMYPMLKNLASDYNSLQSDVNIRIRGGGSRFGLKQLVNNETHFAATSMDIQEDVMLQLSYIDNYEMVIIAFDGIAIVVNKNNPVTQLNLNQASDIFSGKITNWKEAGGNDLAINLIIRNVYSGTAAYMKEYVLKKKLMGDLVYENNKYREYSSGAIIAKNNRQIAELIAQNPGAISYMGMGSTETEAYGRVKALKFSVNNNGPYYEPEIVTVEKRQYELSRPLMLIYSTDNGAGKDKFIEYLKTERAHDAILATGYLDSLYSKIMLKTLRVKGKR
ncbi:MAG: phosphate ABC transporter substrate-binding protein [Spirochaetes bacterium]|nr:phosphate ABC transporter substrate-binding protein [Spirochaetota bacterium]